MTTLGADMRKEAKSVIKLRLPTATIQRIAAIAKLASVTPTQVYNVLLALHVRENQK